MISLNLIFCTSILILETESNVLNEEIVYPSDSIEQQFVTESPEEKVEIFRICEEGIGCIKTDQTWYHKDYRPINLIPFNGTNLKTKFLLIKKSKMDDEKLLYLSFQPKEESIIKSGFNNASELMILIHDFTGNGYTGWIKNLCYKIFLNSMDYNLISIDWQRGAEPPYDQAIANARRIALEIVVLIKELKEKMGYSLDNIHIIGHGVGAHIAGYVGATYNKIKKITGLDPSGPRFQGMPYEVKLNPRCAKYVEVIHTDYYQIRSQGSNESLGHSDFFVNGASKQPGCFENTTFSDLVSIKRGNIKAGDILPGCSHKRAFRYFIESIGNTNCSFQGIKCTNSEDFENGKCSTCNLPGHDCRLFGLKTYLETSENNLFFLHTAANFPFCMLEYRITTFIRDNEKHGYFDFIMIDENAHLSKAYLSAEKQNNYRTLKRVNDNKESGNTFIYFAYPPKLSNIREVKVRWNEKEKLYCKIYCEQTITVEKIIIFFLGTGQDDASEEVTFCPNSRYLKMVRSTYITLKRCNEEITTLSHKKESDKLFSTITEPIDAQKSTNALISTVITTTKNLIYSETTTRMVYNEMKYGTETTENEDLNTLSIIYSKPTQLTNEVSTSSNEEQNLNSKNINMDDTTTGGVVKNYLLERTNRYDNLARKYSTENEETTLFHNKVSEPLSKVNIDSVVKYTTKPMNINSTDTITNEETIMEMTELMYYDDNGDLSTTFDENNTTGTTAKNVNFDGINNEETVTIKQNNVGNSTAAKSTDEISESVYLSDIKRKVKKNNKNNRYKKKNTDTIRHLQ